jgi:hypothetical protein
MPLNPQALRDAAWSRPRSTASRHLEAEHIEHAGNGYYVGLSINA